MKQIFDRELFAKTFSPPIEKKCIYEAENSGPYCTLNDFVKVICATFGAGIMDVFFDRDSPSWCQVWFTADDVTDAVRDKGYSLTLSQAKKYLARLLNDRRRLLEERTSIERGIEYRRVRLLFDTKKNTIQDI